MDQLFRYIPARIVSKLDYKSCKKCQTKLKRQDILAMGIRQSSNKHTLYVEHKCPNCQWREISNFGGEKEGTVEELCYILLESANNLRSLAKSQSLETSKCSGQISEAEIDEFLRFMETVETHEDFMKFIKADKYEQRKDKN